MLNQSLIIAAYKEKRRTKAMYKDIACKYGIGVRTIKRVAELEKRININDYKKIIERLEENKTIYPKDIIWLDKATNTIIGILNQLNEALKEERRWINKA